MTLITLLENLSRLRRARVDIAYAIETSGGTVADGDGFEEFPADIETIPVGGDIQFLHHIGYIYTTGSTSADTVRVHSPSGCTIAGATSSLTRIGIPIITTSSNVFICIPVVISLDKTVYTASVSYFIPSAFPSRYGYKANTMTLHSYANASNGSCTVSASKFNFSVIELSSGNSFADFILKFDKI